MRLPVFSLTFFLALSAICLAQPEKSTQALIQQAHEALAADPAKGRLPAEQLLREALAAWPPSTPKNHLYANASLLACLLGFQARQPDQLLALINETLSIYEAAPPSPPELALALEIKAALLLRQDDKAGAEGLNKKAGGIRAEILEQMGKREDAGVTSNERSEAGRAGGPVSAPKVITNPQPSYSPPARLAAQQGVAVVSVVIGADGRPRDIKLVKSLGFELDEAAYEAVRQWRFEPAQREGTPVPVVATIEVNFRLL